MAFTTTTTTSGAAEKKPSVEAPVDAGRGAYDTTGTDPDDGSETVTGDDDE